MPMTPTLSTPLLAAALTAALLAAPAASAEAQQTDIALVHRILLDRELLLEPAGGAVRIAELGDRLNHADALRTGATTRAAIRFTDDGSLVRLNPSSLLQVRAEGDRSALSKTLELEFGELWARVTRREGASFEVRTPAGVAAVKGTEFLVRVAADGTTTVVTLSGVLDFFTGVGTVEVGSGMQATSASWEVPPQVGAADPVVIEALEGLMDAEAAADEEMVELVLRLQDDQGRVRTLILEVPRSAAARYLEGGR
jgi:ferric-dicitrate binding protein FerR (iron transport regulator)